MLCMAAVVWPWTPTSLQIARTEHVGFSPIRRPLLALSAKRGYVLDASLKAELYHSKKPL